ncbi:hypothetical protein SBOR_4720 [Sclerotinia borealis F-4128]|uniref:Inositol-pentakisphosphate 2-kinase n=1 Tax=Sclerotinia borealis (strain F-4128) TaxID=1432307 RepID=W9CG76_SCLBF|nr:hypothetical protein SBOR_4720 [Sclerotinia borealis F-4128]
MNNLSTQPYRLPNNNINIKVLAEGAANVIYQITVDSRSGEVTEGERDKDHRGEFEYLSGKLLRLRKDVPTTAPTSESHQQWLKYIVPLFKPDQIVTQELVYIGHLNVIPGLNTDLRRFDNTGSTSTSNHLAPPPKGKFYRSRAQSGTFLAKDDYGLLVTDMTPRKSTQETVVEFKPKWLSPSHELPPQAIRCRTCALHARRVAFGEERKNTDLQSYLCPLKLVDSHPKLKFANYAAAASHILHQPPDTPAVHALATWICDNPLLTRLRDLQAMYDLKGSLESEGASHELCVAMTLRDCSLYIRMDGDVDGDYRVVEARLGDLDYKLADKYSSWRRKERDLSDEGWYCGEERRELRQSVDECLLARKL